MPFKSKIITVKYVSLPLTLCEAREEWGELFYFKIVGNCKNNSLSNFLQIILIFRGKAQNANSLQVITGEWHNKKLWIKTDLDPDFSSH